MLSTVSHDLTACYVCGGWVFEQSIPCATDEGRKVLMGLPKHISGIQT
jgi:hypothetical protein